MCATDAAGETQYHHKSCLPGGARAKARKWMPPSATGTPTTAAVLPDAAASSPSAAAASSPNAAAAGGAVVLSPPGLRRWRGREIPIYHNCLKEGAEVTRLRRGSDETDWRTRGYEV